MPKYKKDVLHLGCGSKKRIGSIGVDINKNSQADVIHDLNKFPYPFNSNQFSLIIAEHILEHLDDLTKVLEEIHRIAKPSAKLVIKGPHFTSVDAFTDSTHKHFLTSRTFDYLIPGAYLHKFKYSKARYKLKKVFVGPDNSKNLALNLILKLINKYLIYYEKRFAFIFPVGVISYELEVVKK